MRHTNTLSPGHERLRRLLQKHNGLTYKELEQHLGRSERTLNRWIEELRKADIRVESRGKPKRFSISPEARREAAVPVEFSPMESLALTAGADAALSLLRSTPLHAPLAAAFARLLAGLVPQVDLFDLDQQEHRWFFDVLAINRINADAFGTVLAGMQQGQSVVMDYHKPNAAPSVDRKIDPLCIGVLDNAVMVAAYCHQREAVKDFALTRIQQARLCDPETDTRPYFDRPAGFDPASYYRGPRFGAMAGEQVQDYRIEVAKRAAHLFRERLYHPSQEIEHEAAGGRIVVSFRLAAFERFRSWVQSFGTRVTVLEPPELVERMRADALELAERYG